MCSIICVIRICCVICVYRVLIVCRHRRNVFVKGIDKYLENVLMNMEGLEEDIEVTKENVQTDHVHLMSIIPPRLSVVSVIQFMKSQSAKKMRERFEFIKKAVKRGGVWSRGYYVSTFGMNEKAILKYVGIRRKKTRVN